MNKKIFLIICALVCGYIVFEARSIIVTFLVSLSIAYLLHPICIAITNKSRLSYKSSAIMVFSIFIIILFSLLAVLIPKIVEQLELLVRKIPEFQQAIKFKFIPFMVEKFDQLGPTASNTIKKILADLTSSFGNVATHTANFLWSYILSTINLISMCLLMPVILIFFLKDWPEIMRAFKSFISRLGYPKVNEIWDEADDLIVGFVRSLLNVSLILIIYYSIALNLIGFEFALLFGFITGIAVMVPLIGPFISLLSCLVMSLLIHGFDNQQILIIVVFIIGQGLDGSVLTPKIVGDRIGLHPTAIIFSLLICGKLLGAIGLFLAIPIAGIIKIIFKKFILSAR